MRWIALALVLMAWGLVACGGGDDSSGPEPEQYTGTWIGPYTNTAMPGVTAEGVLQLTQDGDEVTGTLTTNVGRSATVRGEVSGERLEARFTYTDGCVGTAETTADLIDEEVPARLTGNYTSNDCVGETSGGYNLSQQ